MTSASMNEAGALTRLGDINRGACHESLNLLKRVCKHDLGLEPMLHPRLFRSSVSSEVTGISQDLRRDMKRRGYVIGDDAGGWSNDTAHDLAKGLVVKSLRDGGMELSEAWELANEELVGNVVLHALGIPGAMDTNSAKSLLEKNPTLILKWKMEFAAARGDRKHVGGGDYFVFGPTIPANQYLSIESAIEEGTRLHKGPHLVVHVVLLRELSKLLVERAGELAFYAKEGS